MYYSLWFVAALNHVHKNYDESKHINVPTKTISFQMRNILNSRNTHRHRWKSLYLVLLITEPQLHQLPPLTVNSPGTAYVCSSPRAPGGVVHSSTDDVDERDGVHNSIPLSQPIVRSHQLKEIGESKERNRLLRFPTWRLYLRDFVHRNNMAASQLGVAGSGVWEISWFSV